MKRLIIYLIRRRLGIPKDVWFRFTNQKNRCEMYVFESDCLIKKDKYGNFVLSGVSLNWLLDDDCKSHISIV